MSDQLIPNCSYDIIAEAIETCHHINGSLDTNYNFICPTNNTCKTYKTDLTAGPCVGCYFNTDKGCYIKTSEFYNLTKHYFPEFFI